MRPCQFGRRGQRPLSSRGSARGLAPDVGGEHVGLLGGGTLVGRWAFAGRARIRRLGGHAVPAEHPIPGLGQRDGRRAGAAGRGPDTGVVPLRSTRDARPSRSRTRAEGMWAVLLRWARPAAEQISGGQMTWAGAPTGRGGREAPMADAERRRAGQCQAPERAGVLERTHPAGPATDHADRGE